MTAERYTGEWGGPIPGTRRKAPVKSDGGSTNARKQRSAVKRMSVMELECGITPEEFDAEQAAQRARVRARYGVKKS